VADYRDAVEIVPDFTKASEKEMGVASEWLRRPFL
jgi:hypothetical protein